MRPGSTDEAKQSTTLNVILSVTVALLFAAGAEGLCRVLEKHRPVPRSARPHDSEKWGPARFMDWQEWDQGFYTRARRGFRGPRTRSFLPTA